MSAIRFGRGTFYQFFRREDIRMRWDLASAMQFLNEFRKDALIMANFRRQAQTEAATAVQPPQSDDEVLKRIAAKMVRGEIIVALPLRERHRDTLRTTEAEPKTAAAKETKTAEVFEDEPTFESNHDGEAQAEVLKAAAAAGIPFCEECEREHATQGAGR
jgi:hypothetical protein